MKLIKGQPPPLPSAHSPEGSARLQVQAAYAHCRALARNHYENFPVASHLLPRRLRNPVAAIYAFARTADDWADEGDWRPEQRLAALQGMEDSLRRIATPTDSLSVTEPIFIALADSVQHHALPIEPLQDLLHAFRQDVQQQHYADFGELMQYCRRSANPVGRLMLHLFQAATPRNLGFSDALCSALQLINFLQDFQQDLVENRRIYFPQDELQRFAVDEALLATQNNDPRLRQLILFQAQRAHKLLQAGAPLGSLLKGRPGLEIRMIILGAQRTLQQLQQQENLFSRPRLSKKDRLGMLWGAIKGGF